MLLYQLTLKAVGKHFLKNNYYKFKNFFKKILLSWEES